MYEEEVEYTYKHIRSFSFYYSLVKLREVIENTLNLNFGENFAFYTVLICVTCIFNLDLLLFFSETFSRFL